MTRFHDVDAEIPRSAVPEHGAARATRAAVPLDTYRDTSSNANVSAAQPPNDYMSRLSPFNLQVLLRTRSCLAAVRLCGTSPIHHNRPVEISRSSRGHLQLNDVHLCKNRWSCPDCSRRFARQRAEKIQASVNLAQAHDVRVYFLTLTVPHARDNHLADQLKLVKTIWSRTFNSSVFTGTTLKDQSYRPGIRDRFGILGLCSVPDLTVQISSRHTAWHVHRHALVFVRPGFAHSLPDTFTHSTPNGTVLTDEQQDLLGQEAFMSVIVDRWITAANRMNVHPVPEAQHLELLTPNADIGRYLAKQMHTASQAAANELTKSSDKTARDSNMSHTDLLEQISLRPEEASFRFHQPPHSTPRLNGTTLEYVASETGELTEFPNVPPLMRALFEYEIAMHHQPTISWTQPRSDDPEDLWSQIMYAEPARPTDTDDPSRDEPVSLGHLSSQAVLYLLQYEPKTLQAFAANSRSMTARQIAEAMRALEAYVSNHKIYPNEITPGPVNTAFQLHGPLIPERKAPRRSADTSQSAASDDQPCPSRKHRQRHRRVHDDDIE